MKRSHTALLAAGLLLIGTTSAQEPLDNYYPYEQPDYEEESRPMLRPDSTLFYRGVALAEDLYGLTQTSASRSSATGGAVWRGIRSGTRSTASSSITMRSRRCGIWGPRSCARAGSTCRPRWAMP